MDLILWRHAEARDAGPGENDLARPLTTRGEKQAERMAGWLNRVLPASTRVLVSPALRTRQTAAALGRATRVDAALAPGATARQLLDAAQWPDGHDAVLLVGHQPTLGQLAAQLMGGERAALAGAIAVRKGAVWWLRHRQRAGAGEVVLLAALSPELV